MSSSVPPDWTVTQTRAADRASDRILRTLVNHMVVRRAEISGDYGTVLGTIHEPLADNITAIREYFAGLGFVALFRPSPEHGREGARHVVQFGIPASRPRSGSRPAVNIVLFLLTVFTTLLIGSLQQGGNVFFLRDFAADPYVQANYWRVLWLSLATGNPLKLGELLLGVPFSFALLLILGSHELGHYLAARRYGVDASLPYFLPIPHPLMGTMGAFIRIKSPIPDRRALIRLGVAGPLIGFLLAVPIVIVGMMLSKAVPVETTKGSIALGSSLLFGWLSQIFFPNLPAGYDVSLHPLAFAGWLGFFVTALNLIPIGQLDGGHIAYVALGRFRKQFRFAVLAVMVAFGFLWQGWFFWGILILILGLDHPPTQDEITPLHPGDRLLMLIAALVFILTFIPAPFPRGGL